MSVFFFSFLVLLGFFCCWGLWWFPSRAGPAFLFLWMCGRTGVALFMASLCAVAGEVLLGLLGQDVGVDSLVGFGHVCLIWWVLVVGLRARVDVAGFVLSLLLGGGFV